MNKNNQVDLLYLTNQNFIDKYNQKKINIQQNETLDDDIAFYRKRIFNTTKDLLRKNSVNSAVDSSFIALTRIGTRRSYFIPYEGFSSSSSWFAIKKLSFLSA